MGPIFAFTKKIKEDLVLHQDIVDNNDILNIKQVINELEFLPGISKSPLSDLQVRTLHKKWIIHLLETYPLSFSRNEMEYLISEFTDIMQTRMREESKYALGLLMENKVILCHSRYGEQTITEEWKTIRRMLDSGNILRYVSFLDVNGLINVTYWERYPTTSFVDWLGIRQKGSYLYGGDYCFRFQVEGITAELQFTEEQLDQWLKSHPELTDEGVVKFPKKIEQVSINYFKIGNRGFKDASDFMEVYKAEKYGFARYQKEYERINGSPLPMLVKYIDDKEQLFRCIQDEKFIEVSKDTPSMDILFTNSQIDLKHSYLADMISRFINGETIRIFHAGEKIELLNTIKIKGMEILNKLNTNALIIHLVNFYNSTNLLDSNLSHCIEFALFKILGQVNESHPIACFFEKMAEEIEKLIIQKGILTKLEGKVIEYKAGDIFGSNKDIVSYLGQDLEKKLSEYPFKIYLIGVEDDGTFNGLHYSRLTSERIEPIRTGLQEYLGLKDIYACRAIHDNLGILIITALKP